VGLALRRLHEDSKVYHELKLDGDFYGSKYTCRKCEQIKHKARYKPQETLPTPIPGLRDYLGLA
jgi:hypothetical protein